MAKGVNKVIIVGNLGNDPEVRYTPSGSAVATISVATSDSWKDKQSGDLQERTEWHRVVFFNRLAEIVGEYLHKGSKIYVEGALRTRKWQDKAGIERYTTEIVASEMQMLDGKAHGASHESHPKERSHANHNHTNSHSTEIPTPFLDDATLPPAADDDIPF